MPGTSGGSGDFTLAARYLVKKVPGLQVWAIDRRSQALERPEVFAQALSGQVSLQQMFDHYLGWLTNGGHPGEPLPVPRGGRLPLRPPVGDGDRAERRPHRGAPGAGPREGEALGRPRRPLPRRVAHRRIRLVGLQRDAGLQGHRGDGADRRRPDGQLRRVHLDRGAGGARRPRDRQPLLDLLGVGIPEIAGLFGEIGGIYALLAPQPAGDDAPVVPAAAAGVQPAVPRDQPGAAGLRVRPRHLARTAWRCSTSTRARSRRAANPRDWVDGGVTPVQRLAATFGQEPANAIEWYFPRRLSIDTNGANELVQNDVANLLGLRLFHQPKVDIPLYAIQTDLTKGRVLLGASNFIARAQDHEEGVEPGQRRPRAGPPGPAHGRDQAEQVLHHGRRRSCATRSSARGRSRRRARRRSASSARRRRSGRSARNSACAQDDLQLLLRVTHIAGK